MDTGERLTQWRKKKTRIFVLTSVKLQLFSKRFKLTVTVTLCITLLQRYITSVNFKVLGINPIFKSDYRHHATTFRGIEFF